MTWKQLEERIGQMSEEQKTLPVAAVVMGDVFSGEFSSVEVVDEAWSKALNQAAVQGQPVLWQQ